MPVTTAIDNYKWWVQLMAAYLKVQPPVSDGQLESSGMFLEYAKKMRKNIAALEINLQDLYKSKWGS